MGRCTSETRPWWILGAVLLPAIVARWLLFLRYPVFLTSDSPDFLNAAQAIADRFDFFSYALRDWRLPGYPVFLALVSSLTPWTSSWLVGVQKILGLATAALAGEAGRRVAGAPGLVILGLFVGLHPSYLLQEHMVMSESLFVFLLWVVVLCVLAIFERGPEAGFRWGAGIGLVVATTLLVRSNGVFLCFPALAVVWLARVWRDAPDGRSSARSRSRAIRRSLPFVAGVGLALGLVWGAWIVRNQIYLGTPKPFTDNAHRSRIVYLAQHDLLQPDLPEIAAFEFDPEQWNTTYDVILYRLPEGAEEDTARRIVREQISHQSTAYAREVFRAGRHFAGWPVSDLSTGCRVMQGWFSSLVLQQEELEENNRTKLRRSSLVVDRSGRYGRILRAWKKAGLLYLHVGRFALSLVFLASLAVWLARLRRRGVANADWIVVAWVAGLGLVVLAHGFLLADQDRYSVPFDGLFLLASLTALGRCFGFGEAEKGSPACDG